MEILGQILRTYRAEGKLPGPGAATSSDANGLEEPGGSPRCPICGGIGWLRREVPLEDPGFGQLTPCHCRVEQFESERAGRLLKYSNLGALAGVTFQELAPQRADGASQERFLHAREVAMAYAQDPQGWLVIIGPGGSGKTHLAAAIANQCMSRGQTVFFIGVADLLDHLRATYAPSSEIPYDELFDQVRSVPLLILDDLGSQSSTPWAQEKLSQLLGHRYNARAPTVITTDLPLEKLDDRLRARLADPALAHVLELRDPAAAKGGHSLDSLDLPDLARMTFDTFDPAGLNLRGPMRENLMEAFNLAKSYAERPEDWLVFIGGYGCGKTHLAAAIAHHRRGQGDEVLFAFVPDLLDFLRSTFNPEGAPTYEVFDRVKRVGLLILDDFSEASATPWSREKLYQLLNYRYYTRLPTVVTSGLAPEAMEPRLWSRLADPRLSNVYEIKAPDYRTGRVHPARTAEYPERPRARPRGRGQAP